MSTSEIGFAQWLGENGYSYNKYTPRKKKWLMNRPGYGAAYFELEELYSFYKAGGKGMPEPNKKY